MIKFYLNSDLVEVEHIDATETLLDFLRLSRRLTGTKEGCCEGDCGACTVLVGKLELGELKYKSVNSCICFLPSLNNSHIVTVESLSSLENRLHPVQLAMIKSHGSQCGFCTPGIVMSLYDLWLKNTSFTDTKIEKALQGNLCRCTGYGPIIDAAKSINNFGNWRADALIRNRETMKNNLQNLDQKKDWIEEGANSKYIIPRTVESLAKLYLGNPSATLVAGATDVGLWVTKELAFLDSIIFIGNIEGLRKVDENSEMLIFGACVTYSEFEPVLQVYYPSVSGYLSRIAGEQIRNMGTVGGNIANASPIGDLAPLFIALGATLILRKGSESRTIKIEDFFIDYDVQNIKQSEFVEKIAVPINPNLFVYAFKISKRRDEDISTVSAIFSFEVLGQKLFNVRLAFGGMAAIPKRALNAEKVLEGKKIDVALFKLAQLALEKDFSPISDMRASNKYRMRVAKNLLIKCWYDYSNYKEAT